MRKHSFTKTEAADALGMTPRTIHYYTDEELVTPHVANPKGKGTTRKYSRKNLVEFLVIKKLAQNGLDLRTIKQIIKGPRIIGPDGFDPWDPDSGKDTNRRYYAIIYDGTTDHGKLELKSIAKGKPIQLDVAGKYSSALVIDITQLREEVSKL